LLSSNPTAILGVLPPVAGDRRGKTSSVRVRLAPLCSGQVLQETNGKFLVVGAAVVLQTASAIHLEIDPSPLALSIYFPNPSCSGRQLKKTTPRAHKSSASCLLKVKASAQDDEYARWPSYPLLARRVSSIKNPSSFIPVSDTRSLLQHLFLLRLPEVGGSKKLLSDNCIHRVYQRSRATRFVVTCSLSHLQRWCSFICEMQYSKVGTTVGSAWEVRLPLRSFCNCVTSIISVSIVPQLLPS
jgi:hypothetical protein